MAQISSKHLLSPLLFSATLASDISWPRLPGNRSFRCSLVFEGFSRFFGICFERFFWFLEGRKESDGIQSEVPQIDEVQHHDLVQKHHVSHVWYSTITSLVHTAPCTGP